MYQIKVQFRGNYYNLNDIYDFQYLLGVMKTATDNEKLDLINEIFYSSIGDSSGRTRTKLP